MILIKKLKTRSQFSFKYHDICIESHLQRYGGFTRNTAKLNNVPADLGDEATR